ncbi:MAG: fluoride efflux transporter CrcB [Candidatus Omnitrophica bacterium]|jgi:CrcB protein|nr:fluoride efflux transporter CrcB [Candidatus Omnitrophota bacterium]
MNNLAQLLIGGALGTVSRYAMSVFVYRTMGADFPYGTLAVNLTGCFIIGFLAAITEDRFIFGSNIRLFLMIGFCGAFTTFSTFILETANLIKDGESFRALLNVLLSVIIGFLVFRLGLLAGELI